MSGRDNLTREKQITNTDMTQTENKFKNIYKFVCPNCKGHCWKD